MANSVQQQHFQHPHHCKECGLYLNSAESLDVHLQYHKENLLNKWATQASHSEENNNKASIKREFLTNTIAAADSSDSMKKSPEYSRATPETIFGHPPTPQSYQSASSPYQNHDFSPNFQQYPQIKHERTSSPSYNFTSYDNQYYEVYPPQQQYPPMKNEQQQEFVHKSNYRYHPYQQNSQVSSSSPAYPPQPTPSPSPKQCDKCGYVCDSASQLIEHLNVAHPPTPAMNYHHQNQFLFNEQIKEEDAQSEILDLDSHKVHQVFPEEEKRNGDNNHSINSLLNWSPQQQKIYQYPGMEQQKLFHPAQPSQPDFVNVSTSQDILQTQPPPQQPPQQQNYRPFEHLPSPNPVISSSQANNSPSTASPAGTKSSNWKSNEARRPKTYNCTACNKWFTSSGHLKRHYNTTLHKNAVKSSGQPDPATLPISAHHHPARDANTTREDSPPEDSRSDDSLLNYQSGSPNGDAGPSPAIIDSRGLLPPPPPPPQIQPGFTPMVPMENHQFQMYPNESAPHVTQITATNSLSITGEYHHHQPQEHQPLPSFANFQTRYGLLLGYGNANVGGGGPVTAPYTYYPDFEMNKMYKMEEDDEYELTVLTVADPAPLEEKILVYNNNNSNAYNADDEGPLSDTIINNPPPSPEKAHIKRDYEESTGSPLITSTSKQGIHKCIDCDKLFNKACYLTQHNKTFHSGDKPFKCGRCGKRFSSDLNYQEHITKHAGDKPHKCDLCPKQFNHKTDLRRHMCLHTGQKPYSCDTCGKGFIRKDHMLKHCETHFKKTPKVR